MRVQVRMRAYASMYRPFRPTVISGHTRLISGHKMAETYHAIHSVILVTMGNLTSTYADQGYWKEAEEVQIQAVNKLRMTLGEDHLVTITAIASLASLLKDRNTSRHLLALIHVLTSTYKNQRRLSNEEVPMLTNEEGAGNSSFELIMKERLMVVEKAVNGNSETCMILRWSSGIVSFFGTITSSPLTFKLLTSKEGI
jgi:hypothetical protein